ncbi:head-tail adaptor protein [Methylobrevis pamukkalensis]|uniref:Phage head-tail joining protein n=1 Tax=Methylobrevis pamukkalensis TaxID=1439726 RepID=A0A1E3H7Y4_9HYPH|nr:head-tail adaptor protein [Methylobrevis pamukkalensis]ODN72430.1 Phage head-tail joining protein [Methylobrevis pamukkalensis]
MRTTASIGALRHRLSVEEPVVIADDVGGATTVDVVTADTWAAIEPVGLAERVDPAARARGIATHRILLRADVTLRAGWSLAGGGRRYRVLGVTGPDWGFLACLAEEENG